jgi:hypothetical protein
MIKDFLLNYTCNTGPSILLLFGVGFIGCASMWTIFSYKEYITLKNLRDLEYKKVNAK